MYNIYILWLWKSTLASCHGVHAISMHTQGYCPFSGVCNLQNNIDSVSKLLFPFRLSWRVRMTDPNSYVVIHACVYSLTVMYNTFGMIILGSH